MGVSGEATGRVGKTPERLAERLAVGSPFYQDLLGKGLVLYAA